MKNPMDRQLEKRLSQRAVEIGREGEVEAFTELLGLLQSSSANVRRLAASALGKLAWLGVNQAAAVAALAPVVRRDPHAQTRQYAIKALKAYGAAAQDCLHDLRDIAANAAEKDYLRLDAEAAVCFLEEAVQIAADATRQRCQRCHVDVTPAEYARSHQAFQRTFCDRCFDETFLARRNFETTVELSKTVEANDGTVVQSKGERQIAEWLTAHGLSYRYDAKFRIIGEFQIRPDFYLPELDVYIEYWGMDTPQYKMSMYKKQTLYQQEGKRLVSVYPKDLPSLDALLSTKLRAFGYHPQPLTRTAKSGACIAIAPDLQLRPLAPEDAAELFALVDANRAYLHEWLPWLDRNTAVEDSLAFVHSCAENVEKGIPVFAIELAGRIVGICGYNAVDRANRAGWIGYWLDEGAGGCGVMTRSCRAVVDYGFAALGLNRITICAATGNRRSRAVAERLGFAVEGTLREAEWLYDHYVDWTVYSMLKRDWSSQNTSGLETVRG